MLTPTLRIVLVGLAVSASLFGCAHRDAVVSTHAAESARAVGARLVAQDRANEQRHRAAIARLIRVDGVRVNGSDRTLHIAFTVRNLSRKAITALELAFESDGMAGNRIGTAELRTAQAVAGNGTRAIALTVPYIQFGDDTGPMREALGRPQRYTLGVTEIKYADGTDAGYDD